MDELLHTDPTPPNLASDAKPALPARTESICGSCLAVLVMLLALTVLGAGRFDDAQMSAVSEMASAYSWYEAKSVSQSMLEGQYDLLKALQRTGGISAAAEPGIDRQLAALYKDLARFRKEKSEILLGSRRVGRESWVLDTAGKYGQIVGAKVWEDKAAGLDRAGDTFDLAALFLLFSLMLGAISLAFEARQLRLSFFSAMLVLGAVGTVSSAWAFMQALRI